MNRLARPARLSKPLWLLTALFSILPVTAQSASDSPLGASPGERLKFNIHWLGVPAGKMTLDFQEGKQHGYTIRAETETIGLAHFFHPRKDLLLAEGKQSPAGFHSSRYLKDREKNDQHQQTEYRFQRKHNQVLRIRNGQETLKLENVPFLANDPLTELYALRAARQLQPGDRLQWSVVDGKKLYSVSFHVGEADRMYTPLGWFLAFPVKVTIQGSELFPNKEGITVWFSRDRRRLPIRILTRPRYGAITADLIAFDDARGEKREVRWDDTE